MKVLVFSTTYPNSAAPTHGIFVHERIRRLASLAEVRVVAPYPWYRPAVTRSETRDGVQVVHPTYWYVPRFLKWTDPFALFLSALPAVTRLRRTFDFDLIDAHFAYPDGVAAAHLAKWFGRPLVITERGTLPQHTVRASRRAQIRWALDRAARVLAVSHELCDRLERLGVPRQKLAVLPAGVDTERFQPRDQAEARRRLGLPESGRLLVSVGHLSPRKGFQRVIGVLPDLVKEFPDLTLAVIGGPGAEGNNGPDLRRQIAELHLGDHVRMVGPQPPDQVAQWLAAADLFVLATTYEGNPNVVNEALACGLPVVVSRVGEVEYAVPDGAGLLVENPENPTELCDRLREALTRSWDRSAIRTAVEGRTWENAAARVYDHWQAALESTTPRLAAALQAAEPLRRLEGGG